MNNNVLEPGSVWADHRPAYNDPAALFERTRGCWTERQVAEREAAAKRQANYAEKPPGRKVRLLKLDPAAVAAARERLRKDGKVL